MLIIFAQRLNQLVFAGMFRRAGVMTPPTRFRFMPGDHSTESPGKSYVLAGASHKPYGMSEPFSVQQTDRKLAAGRRGHDISPTNYDNVKFQFFAQLRKADKHIILSYRRVLRFHTIWTAPPFLEIPASHT
ncbi:hypothetical protein MR626_09755, partial [bacterium]|nr:hypothetical protein [bacterium]